MSRHETVDACENNGLWDWNLVTNRVFFSPRWISMLGCDEHEVGNTPDEWLRRIHPDDLPAVQAWVNSRVAGSPSESESEHRLLHKDGTYRWMSCRGITVLDGERRAVRLAGSHKDITAERVSDPLTGLSNRFLLLDRLAASIERTRRQSDFLFALLLINLDRFGALGEKLGASNADQMLISVARRLETSLRSDDTVSRTGRDHVLARIEGDEFTVLLDGVRELADATKVGERLLSTIATPFQIGGREVFLTASIGIALSATGYSRAEEVLRDADTAMYRAKSLGKARCEVFDTALLESTRTRSQLEIDLENALARKEFVLAYQPIVALDSNRIAGFEALARWRHPVRGMVSPQEFIALAEKSGLICALGKWVLEEACRQAREWQGMPGGSPDLWVSVNVSSVQFMQPSLVEDIQGALNASGLPPRCLILELTESMIMQNPEAVTSTLMRLRVLGIQMAIDDFGTGYSSLSYLRQFPVDILKIDHFFIRRLGAGQDTAAIVRSMATLSHELGLHVIAEGIEDQEQLNLVRSLNCEFGQGFLFSKPVGRDRAEALLQAGLPPLADQPTGQHAEVTAAPDAEAASKRPSNRRLAAAILGVAALLVISGAIVLFARHFHSAAPQPVVAPPTMDTVAQEPETTAAPPQGQAQIETPVDAIPAPAVATQTSRSAQAPDKHKKTAAGSVAAPRTGSPAGTAAGESGQPGASPKGPTENAPPAAVLSQAVQTEPVPQKASAPRPAPPRTAAPEAVAHTFAVQHSHVIGSCKGTLQVSATALAFFADKPKDSFNLTPGEYSAAVSGGWLTVRSGDRTYKFKSATARDASDNGAELKMILDSITAAAKTGSGRR